MKKQLLFTGFLASGLFLGGCVGAGNDTHFGHKTVNNFGTGPTARKVQTAPAAPHKSTSQVILLGEQKDLCRLTIAGEGITRDEKSLSGSIVQMITGAVSAEDAKVLSTGKGDVHLLVRPKLIQIDKSGEYYRMNCEVSLTLKAVNSNRIFGTKVIKLVSPRRVLGKSAALSQFDGKASKAAAEWCRVELKRIADNEFGVALLTIQLPTPAKGKKRCAQADASYMRAIGANLAKLPNLISYELAGSDAEKGVCTYRVAYFRSAFPNGIANEVSALVRSIVRHK